MIKKLLKYIGNGILAVMIIIAVISVVTNFMEKGRKDYVPGVGPIKLMTVLSGSMIPTFNPGDAVIDRVVNVNSLKKGDVITYHYQGSLTTHRIVEITEKDGKKVFKTKGDNNNVEDAELLPESKVVGKYLFRIPYLGFLLIKMRGPLGFGVIGVLFLFIFGSEILVWLKKDEKGSPKEQDNKVKEEEISL